MNRLQRMAELRKIAEPLENHKCKGSRAVWVVTCECGYKTEGENHRRKDAYVERRKHIEKVKKKSKKDKK